MIARSPSALFIVPAPIRKASQACLAWLNVVAHVFVFASIMSAVLIALGHRQKMAIMNLVWPITALYFGPIGLWAYWAMGRTKAQGPGGEHASHQHQHGDHSGKDGDSYPANGWLPRAGLKESM
ncbi:MAG: hypothetical protein ACYC61_14475 [Isosphaeraceae bacterium]